MISQIFKTAIVLLVASVMFVSCNNDDNATPQGPTTIEGKWVGKYGYDDEEPSTYYCFKIKAGGEIQELRKNGSVLGSGTWQLVDDVFTATLTWDPPYSSTFMVTATFNKDKGELNGVWGYEPSDADGGLWYMHKEQE